MASSATVGTAVIKLSFDGKGVKAELNGVTKELESTGQSTGSRWGSKWAVAAGNLIASGIRKVGSMVTNTMGAAISRLDTLNNFPRVMTSLGHSAAEADKSVEQMDKGLDGLPTTLDAMSSDVQKLAASMGNLANGEVNATSVGLGLNDMLLAGGKGTERASAAMEQYNQMLARGKVDQQSWNSLVDAAPGQMNQLAQSILGAGKNQSDLYAAMQKGEVTFDQFNAAVVKLDKEGGDGFASLHDQAVAATDGIQTQIQNVQTSWTKLVTDALAGNFDAMEGHMQQLVDRVTKLVPTLVNGFVSAFEAFTQVLPQVIKNLLPVVLDGLDSLAQSIIGALPEIINLVAESLPMILDKVTMIISNVLNIIINSMPEIINAIMQIINTIALFLTNPTTLQLLLSTAIQLFMAIIQAIPEIIVSLAENLPTIIDNIVAFLTSPDTFKLILGGAVQLFKALVVAVPRILGSLIGAFGKLVAGLWNGIKGFFGKFAADFGNFITGIFKNAINGVLTFIENFINMPIDILNGFIDVINSVFGVVGVNLGNIDRISLPRLAQGGIALNATTAIIGEAGKEAVLPLENNTDNWAGLLANTLVAEMERENLSAGGGVNIENQEFIINNQMDAEEIGRVMMQSIRRAA